MRGGNLSKRGISEVLSGIIICSVVLVIGASVWSVTQSASSIMASSYFDEVMGAVGNIEERFNIENIGIKESSNQTLMVWVSNYGRISVNITSFRVYAGINNTYFYPNSMIISGEIKKFELYVNPSNIEFYKGLNVYIQARSERGNKVYGTVIIQ